MLLHIFLKEQVIKLSTQTKKDSIRISVPETKCTEPSKVEVLKSDFGESVTRILELQEGQSVDSQGHFMAQVNFLHHQLSASLLR